MGEQKKDTKEKENIDIYVTLTATEDFNWLNVLRLEKDVPKTINKTLFDKLVDKFGNFNLAVEQGRIKIGA
jgi:hypothetical protein